MSAEHAEKLDFLIDNKLIWIFVFYFTFCAELWINIQSFKY